MSEDKDEDELTISVPRAAISVPARRHRVKQSALARILARDLLEGTTTKSSDVTTECLQCGRSFTPRPDTDDPRFCWGGCYEAFHVGLPPCDPDELKKLSQLPFTTGSNFRVVAGPPSVTSFDPFKGSKQLSRGIRRRGSSGWVIECIGCGAEFDSKGSRCCSADCERRYREHCENEQLMAEAGMEQPVKRKCEAAGCGRDIPAWRNGRRVQERVRFCSQKCRRRHAKAS
jgi:hypothetical protein